MKPSYSTMEKRQSVSTVVKPQFHNKQRRGAGAWSLSPKQWDNIERRILIDLTNREAVAFYCIIKGIHTETATSSTPETRSISKVYQQLRRQMLGVNNKWAKGV